MKYKKIKYEDTTKFNKCGVDFIGYGPINDNMSFVMETVEKGHFEEFIHDKSTFTYIFLASISFWSKNPQDYCGNSEI